MIKKKLSGRAVWLCPLDHVPPGTNYLVAITLRAFASQWFRRYLSSGLIHD
jgi:hypothetical protein